MISDAALRDFKQVWLAQFGQDIPDDVAMDEAEAVRFELTKAINLGAFQVRWNEPLSDASVEYITIKPAFF